MSGIYYIPSLNKSITLRQFIPQLKHTNEFKFKSDCLKPPNPIFRMIFPFSALLVSLFFATTALASTGIPSFGLQTVQAIRNELPDSEFRIDPSKGTIIKTPDFTVQVADLSNFPALAGQDVQSQITRVFLRAGKPFITHFHPRSGEVLNAIRGTFRVSFTTEGLNPRVITNVIRSGQSTVFPQGLVHTTTCISKHECMFLAVFTSADAGLIPV